MKSKKFIIGILGLTAAAVLAACSTESGREESAANSENVSSKSAAEAPSISSMKEDMGDMAHDDTGEIPAGLQEAKNPTYKVGDTVTILTGHMAGMEGAEGTVTGAFETIAYEISYDPANGGQRVDNHKWIIQEEIAEAGTEPLEPGTEVIIEANHMGEMNGATAIIKSAEKTTVYMLDFQPTTGKAEVKNHKWVTEAELSAQ